MSQSSDIWQRASTPSQWELHRASPVSLGSISICTFLSTDFSTTASSMASLQCCEQHAFIRDVHLLSPICSLLFLEVSHIFMFSGIC